MRTYAAVNKNEKIRLKSASGGIASLIAEHILDKGGVVYGVENNIYDVSYIRLTQKKELYKIRGSKYVRVNNFSKTVMDIKEDIKKEKIILFIGIPCLVAAVRNIMNKYNYKKFLLVDLICHGVSNPKVYRSYILHIEKEYGCAVEGISFRDKSRGWRNQNWKIILENGTELKDEEINSFKKIYYSHYAHLEGCFKCRFTNLTRYGDITLGDLWGIEKVAPEMDDNKGTSLVLLNTPKGTDVFEELEKYVELKEIDISMVMQPQLREPIKVNNEERHLFNWIFEKKGYEEATKIMFSRKLKDRLRRNIRIKFLK